MFVINNQAFGYGNLDEVGGDKAEGEEEDGVEDAHGEVEEVLVLLRHVAFVHVEELEAVVPNFCSKDQWTESKGGDEEEECSKENVIAPQEDAALHVLPHDVSGGWRNGDVPISGANVLLKELHSESLNKRFETLDPPMFHLARRV